MTLEVSCIGNVQELRRESLSKTHPLVDLLLSDCNRVTALGLQALMVPVAILELLIVGARFTPFQRTIWQERIRILMRPLQLALLVGAALFSPYILSLACCLRSVFHRA